MNAKEAAHFAKLAAKLKGVFTEAHRQKMRDSERVLDRAGSSKRARRLLRTYLDMYIRESVMKGKRNLPFFTMEEKEVKLIKNFFERRGFKVTVKISTYQHPRYKNRHEFDEAKFMITY